MKKNQEAPQSTSATNVGSGLVSFLTRNRSILTGVGIAVLAGVVALMIVLSVQNGRIQEALVAVERLEQDFSAWEELDTDARETGFEELRTTASAIMTSYSGTYSAVRAQMITAEAQAIMERWSEASEGFESAAAAARGSYLAPVALMAAAASSENGDDPARALELYQRVVTEYGETTPQAPRAAFAVGRILESQDRIAEAADAYRSLVEDYPASSWTNLARNRIISLTVEGRIGG